VLKICDRYGFNSEGFKVVHDRLKLRNELQIGELCYGQGGSSVKI